MADKIQINPLVTVEARELLRHACQAQGLAQGDILEVALREFVEAKAGRATPIVPASSRDALESSLVGSLILEKLAELDKALRGTFVLLETIANRLEPKDTPPVPIATYDQMYGPIEAATDALDAVDVAAADVLPVQPPSSRLRRWFMKEAS